MKFPSQNVRLTVFLVGIALFLMTLLIIISLGKQIFSYSYFNTYKSLPNSTVRKLQSEETNFSNHVLKDIKDTPISFISPSFCVFHGTYKSAGKDVINKLTLMVQYKDKVSEVNFSIPSSFQFLQKRQNEISPQQVWILDPKDDALKQMHNGDILDVYMTCSPNEIETILNNISNGNITLEELTHVVQIIK